MKTISVKPRSKPRVAVFGDFMVDVYYCGHTTRISPEAPIPVVKVDSIKVICGGAGNVASNLKNLGCVVTEFSGTQSDQVPVKSRLMVGDTQIARWDKNDVCQPYNGAIPNDGFDAVVVADYCKGAITPQAVEAIKSINAPLFVDTKGDPSVWSGHATAIFPNRNEFDKFKNEYSHFRGRVIMKLGEYGLHLYGGTALDLPCKHARARFVRSVNGAGDTVIAAAIYKYLQTVDGWLAILAFANAAAGVAVEHPYTYAPTLEEVERRLAEQA